MLNLLVHHVTSRLLKVNVEQKNSLDASRRNEGALVKVTRTMDISRRSSRFKFAFRQLALILSTGTAEDL